MIEVEHAPRNAAQCAAAGVCTRFIPNTRLTKELSTTQVDVVTEETKSYGKDP